MAWSTLQELPVGDSSVQSLMVSFTNFESCSDHLLLLVQIIDAWELR